ncbi:hypothetical protein BD289DRAFT_10150 [Coniella lustricola]|uniref:Uncharacterized protein n=1 Tax=Coniella lustricola TaxID=2025994 RepID=A0A2T3A4F0_9PEZI|nr:hypothetical protein BD289DRAFT_10150 [Coniella lustricola]
MWQTKVEQLQGDNDSFARGTDQLKGMIDSLEQDIRTHQNENTKIVDSNNLLKHDLTELKGAHEDLKQENTKANQYLAKDTNEISVLKKRLIDSQLKDEASQIRYTEQINKTAALEIQHSELVVKIQELETKRAGNDKNHNEHIALKASSSPEPSRLNMACIICQCCQPSIDSPGLAALTSTSPCIL